MPDGKDKIKKLHANLVSEGYDLPEFSVFDADMADSTKRDKLYKSLVGEGYDLPDFSTFSVDMGYGQKKNEVVPSGGAPVGLQPTSVGTRPVEAVHFDPNKVRGYEDLLKQRANLPYENAAKVRTQEQQSNAFQLMPRGGISQDGLDIRTPLMPEYKQKQAELDKQIAGYEKEVVPLFDKAIDRVKGQFTTKDGQIDYNKVFGTAAQMSKDIGGSDFTKEVIAQKLIAAEKYNQIKPEVDKVANAKLKAKIGKTVDELYDSKEAEMQTQALSEKAYVETQFANEQKVAAEKLQTKSKEIFEADYKPLLEQAQTKEDYDAIVNQYVSQLKSMQSEENSRLKRIGTEMFRQANQKIDGLAKKIGITPKEKAELEAAYQSAYTEVAGKKVKGDQVIQEALAKIPGGKTALAGKAFAEGFNTWLASTGSGLVSLGLNNGLTDWLRGRQEQADRFKTNDIPLEGKNWFDPNAYTTRLMKQLGMQGVPLAATFLTRNPYIGGTLGAAAEGIQIVGDTYNQVLQETGNPEAANLSAQNAGASTVQMLPLYVAEAELFLGATKGFKKAALSTIGQVPIEYAQELGQGYAQDKQISDRNFAQFVNEEGGNIFKETAVLTILQQGAFGGIGEAYKAIGSKNKGVTQQYILDVARRDGVAKAGAVAEQLALNESLTEQELIDTKELIGKLDADFQAMREAGIAEPQIQAYAANIAEANEIRKQEEELSTDSPMRQTLAQKRMQLESEARKIASGEGTSVSVTMPNGTVVSIPEANATATIEGLSTQIGNGSVKVTAEGANAAAINEQVGKTRRLAGRLARKPKEEAQPVASEVSPEPLVEPTAPIQKVQGAETGEAAPVTVELSTETPAAAPAVSETPEAENNEQVYYHGTAANFDEFEPNKTKSGAISINGALFFSSNKKIAKAFADQAVQSGLSSEVFRVARDNGINLNDFIKNENYKQDGELSPKAKVAISDLFKQYGLDKQITNINDLGAEYLRLRNKGEGIVKEITIKPTAKIKVITGVKDWKGILQKYKGETTGELKNKYKGYDVLIFKDIKDYPMMRNADELGANDNIVVLNKDVIVSKAKSAAPAKEEAPKAKAAEKNEPIAATPKVNQPTQLKEGKNVSLTNKGNILEKPVNTKLEPSEKEFDIESVYSEKANAYFTPSELSPYSGESWDDAVKRIEKFFGMKYPYPLELIKEAAEIFSAGGAPSSSFDNYVYKRLKNYPAQPTNQPTPKDKPKAATENKEGVAEAVQPSTDSVGEGRAAGSVAVPVNGSAVSMTSKTDKKPINYYWKNDGWYFLDSRGKEQKETAAKQEEITKFFGEVSGKKLAQVAPEFEQELAAIIEDFPDATLEEIMEEVEDSRPEMIATPELRAETEGRVQSMITPAKTTLQKAIESGLVANDKKWYAKVKDELAKVFYTIFGLNDEKADAAAEIAHLIIVNEAKLNGISVAEQYQRYAFAQAEGEVDDALFQEPAEKKISVNGKELTVKPLPEGLAVVNGFYSPIEKRILEFKQPTASATKWKEIVGTKEEAKFTGVAEWLDTKKPNEQVSKSDVLAWMRDNRIEVVEVVKGVPQFDKIELSKVDWNEVDEDSDLYGDYDYESSDGEYRVAVYSDGNMVLFDNEDVSISKIQSINEDIEVESDNADTKFAQYQLEGDKTNYREVLVTLPTKQPNYDAVAKRFGLDKVAKEKYGKDYSRLDYTETQEVDFTLFSTDKNKFREFEDAKKAEREKGVAKFSSQHFDEPDILVHLRFSNRIDADGNKVLHLSEIQSDYGQRGKKEGFREATPKKDIEAVSNYNMLINKSKELERKAVDFILKGKHDEIKKEFDELNDKISESKKNLPDYAVIDDSGFANIDAKSALPEAPFVTDTNAWVKLGLKTAARFAVQDGATKITWETGETQNDRYDLSKQVDAILYSKNNDGTYDITATRNRVIISQEYNVKANKLEDLIGKEVAQKVVNGEGIPPKPNTAEFKTTLEGNDLKIGGKGMKGFYGSPTEGTLGIVGKVAESLFKQIPKTTQIKVNEDRFLYDHDTTDVVETDKAFILKDKEGNSLASFSKEEGLRHPAGQVRKQKLLEIARKNPDLRGKVSGNSTQHSIDITPDIIAEVTQGMPLFQNNGLGAQGAIVMQAANRVVYAMTNPNVTTPLHEMAHGYFDTLISAAENGNAQAAADVKVFAEQAGVSAADLRTDEAAYTKAQELFARGFERYLRDGKAPTPELQSLFDKFKNWLLEIYKSLAESPIDVPLNDAMRAVYGRMLTPEQVKQDFPPNPPVSNPVTQEEKDDITGITHADTEKDRIEAGLPPYDKTTKSDDDLEAEANELIEKGWNFEKNIDKVLQDGKILSDAEQVALGKYKIYLRDIANAAPTNANINAYERVLKALEFSGTIAGRALRARQLPINPEPTLADFLVRQKEESGVDELTPAQFEQNRKEFEALQKASQEWEAKFKALEAEAIAKAAEENLSSKKKNKPKTPRTKENIRKERDEILQRIKDRIKKSKEGKTIDIDGEQVNVQEANVVPYLKQLMAIAPEIPALVSNYIEEGVLELSDIAKRLKKDLKDEIPDITEEDAIALIAGEYKTGNKKTRNEIQKTLYDLRAEAKLIGQLQALENGEVPKEESKKVERNRKLTELRKQIKAHPNNQLPEYKKQVQRNIDKLQRDLDSGNFAAPPKKLTVTLDKEARELKRKLVDLKTEREVRLLRESYEKMGIGQKVGEKLLKVANIPRTLMASMDFSAPLRQAVIATIGNPTLAFKAFGSMFKAAFNKGYMDEWFFDLENDPNYEIMKESGLSIADPNSPFLRAREEAFMSGYVEKVEGFIGEKLFGNKNFGFVQGSERAYVMYLNKMRVDLFNKYAAALEQKGKTYDNSPETYKAIAKYVNNVTGRGNMGKAEEAAKYLNQIFFSPRLIASRLSLMNPYYIAKMPLDVKKIYLKDMAAFISTGLTVIGMIYLAGGGDEEDDIWVETDPRSSDFMKIRQGEKRWDIWGGFQQYIRTMVQYFSGEKKSPTTDEITELKEDAPYGETKGKLLTRFVRNKLAPLPSTYWDLTSGRNSVGEKVTVKDELIGNVLPLLWQQVYEVAKAEGAFSAITIGVPSVFGVGTERYGERAIEAPDKIKVGAKEYKLNKEMQEKLQVMIEAETKIITDKAKKLPEYESATKKQKVELISTAKLLARKEATKDFQKKYKKDFPEETAAEKRQRKDEEDKKSDLNKSVKKLMK